MRMKISRRFRELCLAAVLAIGAGHAAAAVVLDWTGTFTGTTFQWDLKDFSISQVGDYSATLTDNANPVAFSSLGMAVLKTGGAAVAGPLSAPGSVTFSVSSTGSYTAAVWGTPASPSGQFHIQVAAVPEPEIWAMMLVGGGLVGFQLHRKRKAAEASRLPLD